MATTPSGQRPRFNPSPCDVHPLHHDVPPLRDSDSNDSNPLHFKFQSLVSCPADVPLELFETAVSQLIHHPEYNSTLILRSETISDSDTTIPSAAPRLEGYCPVRNVHRKLLPRRPGRDSGLEQHCTLYALETGEFAGLPSMLVLTPLVPEGESLPYYHPTVSHLAFRFIPSNITTTSDSTSAQPALRIEVTPLPGTPTDLNSRLYRTALALLDTLHRYLWGTLTHYQKRVQHDVLIPREVYQDVYLKMRERHKGIVNTWKESTDPLKHVFEDIGIATYLMLFWKDMFATSSVKELDESPWKSWPRPSGFLDLGCGNGLLTHILSAEGYAGYGIDLRARTSWAHYPDSSQAALKVHALDPTQLLSPGNSNSNDEGKSFWGPGVFLIGNHADELTPWLPVLATLTGASGYLSIPCCAWMFDERFTRSSAASALDFSEDELLDAATPVGTLASEAEDEAIFIASLGLGAEGTHKSQYSAYRIWLARLSRWLGWKIECDTLRIPSTRNWAIVGRERLPGDQSIFVDRARRIVEDVVRRGAFKTRTPEGKGHDGTS
ncbi:hypothetical protein DEU56DRAFT_202623 [Suillus clintonianus]|uniref:uncharacterized protein n=1 Tax=Suillus clintonianus TaxID=1904413 RepID=UPI001B86E665|nr:uncharacterized protein DEU56DRAFT_202623 [Suillus clintonianus]KAG2112408.1 hypothetical protein DEU56DRAFT_202623 [Suillus clintonianus]